MSSTAHILDLPPTLSKTMGQDVDAIIAGLEAFVTEKRKKSKDPVPLVLYAHGGLVDAEAGVRIANAQVDWWTKNGAYAVHFVWHTGFATSLWGAVKAAVAPSRGVGEIIWNTVLEAAARAGQGAAIWGQMKDQAENVTATTGGAGIFARKLGEWMRAHKNWVTVHAIGHSAGSIFHSYFIPAALASGVPRIDTLSLLAPAVRVDTFKQQLLPLVTSKAIASLAIFTMRRRIEEEDTCLGVYKRSLLYLIRMALEEEREAEILGLQESIDRDPELARLLVDRGALGELILATTPASAVVRSRTQARSHGAFDSDVDTMTSVAHRVRGKAPVAKYPGSGGRDVEALWPSAAEAERELGEELERKSGQPTKRALCIGIDKYPPGYELHGCVADAEGWARTLETGGFSVEILRDTKATRATMIRKIGELISSSRAGDVIALQYSGHGTTVPDDNHDERPEEGDQAALFDEALCPVDFAEGNLLLDDDLGELWDTLPDGVSLTIFFDSCHSGGGQREVGKQLPGARYATLTRDMLTAFRQKRPDSRAVRPEPPERGYFYGACLASEVAYEHDGQGDFTKATLPLLGKALAAGTTNEQLSAQIIKEFGSARVQTPILLVPAGLEGRAVLTPATTGIKDAPPAVTTDDTRTRNQRIAAFLRATADLLDDEE